MPCEDGPRDRSLRVHRRRISGQLKRNNEDWLGDWGPLHEIWVRNRASFQCLEARENLVVALQATASASASSIRNVRWARVVPALGFHRGSCLASALCRSLGIGPWFRLPVDWRSDLCGSALEYHVINQPSSVSPREAGLLPRYYRQRVKCLVWRSFLKIERAFRIELSPCSQHAARDVSDGFLRGLRLSSAPSDVGRTKISRHDTQFFERQQLGARGVAATQRNRTVRRPWSTCDVPAPHSQVVEILEDSPGLGSMPNLPKQFQLSEITSRGNAHRANDSFGYLRSQWFCLFPGVRRFDIESVITSFHIRSVCNAREIVEMLSLRRRARAVDAIGRQSRHLHGKPIRRETRLDADLRREHLTNCGCAAKRIYAQVWIGHWMLASYTTETVRAPRCEIVQTDCYLTC